MHRLKVTDQNIGRKIKLVTFVKAKTSIFKVDVLLLFISKCFPPFPIWSDLMESVSAKVTTGDDNYSLIHGSNHTTEQALNVRWSHFTATILTARQRRRTSRHIGRNKEKTNFPASQRERASRQAVFNGGGSDGRQAIFNAAQKPLSRPFVSNLRWPAFTATSGSPAQKVAAKRCRAGWGLCSWPLLVTPRMPPEWRRGR